MKHWWEKIIVLKHYNYPARAFWSLILALIVGWQWSYTVTMLCGKGLCQTNYSVSFAGLVRWEISDQHTQRVVRVGWRRIKEHGKWTWTGEQVWVKHNCRFGGHPLIVLGFPNHYSLRDRKYKRGALHLQHQNQSNNHNISSLNSIAIACKSIRGCFF